MSQCASLYFAKCPFSKSPPEECFSSAAKNYAKVFPVLLNLIVITSSISTAKEWGVEGIWDWRFRHKQVEDDEYTRGAEFSVIVHLYC
jgi:hypothetical protein